MSPPHLSILTEFETGLLEDMTNYRINSYHHLMMKMKLAGYRPTPNLMIEILYMLSIPKPSTDDGELASNQIKMICDSLERGLLSGTFNDRSVFLRLISIFSYLKETGGRLLNSLAVSRPGLIFNFYMKNNDIFRDNYGGKFSSGVEYFELYVMALAKRLSEKNPRFEERYGNKILRMYEDNQNFHKMLD